MESTPKYQYYSFQQIPRDNYNRAMDELAEMFEQTLKANLAKKYPFAPGYFGQNKPKGFRDMTKKTGSLYRSISVSYDENTNQIKTNMLNYWQYVNDGRKPGKYVPLKPLMDWMKAKGFNRDTRGRFKKFNMKGIAFAISASIKKFGIQPTNFYDDSFDVFIKAFNEPDGPASQLGIDLQEFLIKIIQEPIE